MAQQEVEMLWEELESTEQDIEATERELKEATEAEELPKRIALIEKKKDRLVTRKKAVHQQLRTLHGRLASLASTSSLSDEQLIARIQPQLLERILPQLKRQIEDELVGRSYKRERSGATISLPFDSVDKEKLWQHHVVSAHVPCDLFPLRILLAPSRSILAELRYLRFLLMEAPAVSLRSVMHMGAQGQQDGRSHDPAEAYRPVVAALAEAAAAGQPEISFSQEDPHGSARPDLCFCINGQAKYPSVCKAEYGCADKSNPDGIASNRAALSKLLKDILSLHGNEASGRHTCLYFSGCEFVCVAEFLFNTPGELTSVHVSPAFTYDPVRDPPQGRLMDLAQLGQLSSNACLSDLLPPAMPAGFGFLVQYADTLCELEGMDKVQLTASWMDNQPVDFTDAHVIASSMKSLVVRLTPASNSVVKISLQQLVAHEREMHLILDGRSPHLRSMTSGDRYAEVSSGVLPGLAMLELAGFGEPLQSCHMQRDRLGLALVWDQASEGLSAMHAAGVLHRDPKPSNLLVINGVVKLSDFDVSCRMEDEGARRNLAIGTPKFHSPKLAQRYEERDDWLALALALLQLVGMNITYKQFALESACKGSWLPERMRTCIRQSLAS